jgi:hypothetical protein
MRKKSPSPRRLLAHAAVILAVATGLAAVYSCSLIVETRSQQCQADTDCASLAGSNGKCDTTSGLCQSGSTTTSSGTGGATASGGAACNVDGGIDGGGCYNAGVGSCPAAISNSQILNVCTTGCIPFDDTLVKGLNPDGTRPSLPAPPDGGL